MARRTSKSTTDQTSTELATDPTTETTEESVVTDDTSTTEAPVETDETATESTPTEADTSAAEAPAEVALDLAPFEAAVELAVSQRDTATGDLALAVIDPVNQEFRKLPGIKGKNAGKALLNKGMKSSMDNVDIQSARAYMTLIESMTTSGGSSSTSERAPRVPVDPTEAFVQVAAGLRLAINLVGENVPEGVEDGWKEKVTALVTESGEQAATYLAWVTSDAEDKGDEPEVSAVVKAAVKLSVGKSARVGGGKAASGTSSPYLGERRDTGKHILHAFEGKESGAFLSISEIRKATSPEYGDSLPSAGAISARLFPKTGKMTLEGVVPAEENGKKGAKLA